MNRFHGMCSLILIAISIAIGVIAIWFVSIVPAMIYMALTIAAFGCVLYFYCLKCTCRLDSCGHVLPGKLTTLFPPRPPGKYSAFDMAATSVAMVVIVLFPQYWLWKYKPLFFIFWTLLVIGVIDILFYVCKDCDNELCLICPKFKRNQ